MNGLDVEELESERARLDEQKDAILARMGDLDRQVNALEAAERQPWVKDPDWRAINDRKTRLGALKVERMDAQNALRPINKRLKQIGQSLHVLGSAVRPAAVETPSGGILLLVARHAAGYLTGAPGARERLLDELDRLDESWPGWAEHAAQADRRLTDDERSGKMSVGGRARC